MCIDIDPDSVIHKHLVKKLDDLDESSLCTGGQLYYHRHQILKLKSNDYQGYYARADHYYKPDDVKHNLTMLDSFHISLGKPPEDVYPSVTELKLADDEQFHQLIGLITLADIHISKKETKKSAWIEIGNPKDPRDRYPSWLVFCQTPAFPDLNVENYLRRKDGIPHISLANKTGNPHGSIARPEDCIIDTITA